MIRTSLAISGATINRCLLRPGIQSCCLLLDAPKVVTGAKEVLKKRRRSDPVSPRKRGPQATQPLQICALQYAADGSYVLEQFEAGQPCYVMLLDQKGLQRYPTVLSLVVQRYFRRCHLARVSSILLSSFKC